jgi:high-affinity iron transporter
LEAGEMFQSLVVTLREGVEAALIVGIVLGWLEKTGREAWRRIVYWGILAAVLASLVAAYYIHRFEIAEEAYEGWLLVAGAVFVSSMVVWMWRAGKQMKQQIEVRLTKISARPTRAGALALFLFVFLMVGREGIETALLLAAVSLRSSELLNFMGGLIGLGLAIGLGVAFFQGSLKVKLREFFTVTSLVLTVVAVQLAVSGLHELSEARILPSSQREMALIGPLVNNEALFFLLIVALASLPFMVHRFQSGHAVRPGWAQLPAPERRKLLAREKRDRFWKLAATALGAIIMVLISAEFIYSRSVSAVSPPEQVDCSGGQVKIPVSGLSDHKLHKYVADVEGTGVRFIAILDPSDTIRVGLDACQICGTQGYYQDGKNVICRNCAAAVYVPTIGSAGGCNPIKIEYLVENQALIISGRALAEAARYFK